jgi:hypothetical protein
LASNLILTTFYPQQTSGKVPYSPYGDESFVFESFPFKTNIDFFGAQVSRFLLNIPLTITKPHRAVRKVKDLEHIIAPTLTYFILDVDYVYSEYAQNKIIDYFKDYRCILGESRSYNGVDNFNLKGVIFIEEMDLQTAKATLLEMKKDIEEHGSLDQAALSRAAYNAPILKNVVKFNNEKGKLVKPSSKKVSDFFKRSAVLDIDVSKIFSFGEASTIEEYCLMTFSHLGFSVNKTNTNGSLSFNHPSEVKTTGGFFWYQDSPFIMHHGNSFRTVDIFETVRNSPEGKKLLSKNIDYKKELGLPELFQYNKTLTYNEEFLDVHDKIDLIREFLHKRNGVLSIKSPMGSGKSNIISNIIDQSLAEDKKVIIITNRISVAEDYYSKYKEFDLKLYNKDKYNVGDSLIVQFDSLNRYSMKFFDVVIIDEFMSLIIHARNNLTESNSNILKLFGTFPKKMVIADAFLTGFEQHLLQKTENAVLIDNIYRDDCALFQYENKAFFVTEIVRKAKALQGDEKISISCTSLSMLNGLRYILEKSGIDVVTLTSETPNVTKKLVYDLFTKKTHDKFQVVIYSPTLTVGVSNLNNVKDHFHFDGSMSCDVISSIQMIKRSRNAKNIHFYIKSKIQILKTSYESIKDYYVSSINKSSDDSYIFDIDDYGDMVLSQAGKKALRIDTFNNLLEFNHKEAFLYLLQNQFSNEVQIVKTKSESVIDSIIKEINTKAKERDLSFIDDYFKLSGIDKEAIIKSKYKTKEEIVFHKFIEIEESLNVPFGLLDEALEICIKDTGFITKLKRFSLFSSNKTEQEIKNIQSKNISLNKQDELVFLNNLMEFTKSSEKLVKSFYTPRELQGKENKLLVKIITDIGYEKDSSGIMRFPEKIAKYAKYLIR